MQNGAQKKNQDWATRTRWNWGEPRISLGEPKRR